MEYTDVNELDDAGWRLIDGYGSACAECVKDGIVDACDWCWEWKDADEMILTHSTEEEFLCDCCYEDWKTEQNDEATPKDN